MDTVEFYKLVPQFIIIFEFVISIFNLKISSRTNGQRFSVRIIEFIISDCST